MPDGPSSTWRVDASGSGFVETRSAEYDEDGQLTLLVIEVALPSGATSVEQWLHTQDGSVMHTGSLVYPDDRVTIVTFPGPGLDLVITHLVTVEDSTSSRTWTYATDGSAVAQTATQLFGPGSTGTITSRDTYLTDGSLSGESSRRSELVDTATGHRTVHVTDRHFDGSWEDRRTVFDKDGNVLDDVTESHVIELPPGPPPRETLPRVPTPPPVPPPTTGGGAVVDLLPTLRRGDGRPSGVIHDWWYVDESGDTHYIGST